MRASRWAGPWAPAGRRVEEERWRGGRVSACLAAAGSSLLHTRSCHRPTRQPARPPASGQARQRRRAPDTTTTQRPSTPCVRRAPLCTLYPSCSLVRSVSKHGSYSSCAWGAGGRGGASRGSPCRGRRKAATHASCRQASTPLGGGACARGPGLPPPPAPPAPPCPAARGPPPCRRRTGSTPRTRCCPRWRFSPGPCGEDGSWMGSSAATE